jgi:hypothetical protein
MKVLRIAALVLTASALCVQHAFAQNANASLKWTVDKPLQEQNGWQVAAANETAKIPLTEGMATNFDFRFGNSGPQTSFVFQGADGKVLSLTMGAHGMDDARYTDAKIGVLLTTQDKTQLFNGDYFVRPNPARYTEEDNKVLLEKWNSLPKASEAPVRFKITLRGGYVGIWLNNHYIGGQQLGAASLELKLQPGNAIQDATTQALTDEKFVPIGIEGNARAGFTFDAPALQRGQMQTIDGVPFAIAPTGESIDVAKTRWLVPNAMVSWFLDYYYSRSSFDNIPETIMLAVPSEDYSSAHLICAVDPSADKSPVLTLRLSRYKKMNVWNGGVGDGIADSMIRLKQTNGQWPQGVHQIGTTKAKAADGKEIEMPLLEVTVPLRSGEIPDLIDGLRAGDVSSQYLDLEFTKELFVTQPSSHSQMTTKLQGKPSGVNILAVTLERAAVKVREGKRQTGNVFYANENVGFDLKMTNRSGQKFSGILTWTLTDYYGKTKNGSQKVLLDAAAKEITVPLNISGLGLGWYQANLALTDANYETVWQMPTSLAVLTPDTRKAGAESPFGTWWDRNDHGGTTSIAEIAPLLQRMGLRHVTPAGEQYTNDFGKDFAKYGISVSMLPWPIGANLENAKKRIDREMARYPNAQYAMIFHESGVGVWPHYPREALGKPLVKLDEKQQKAYDDLMAVAIPYARYIREKYPQLKLIVGNGSPDFARTLMTNGYPKDLVDYWGDEVLKESIVPETPTGNDWYWTEMYSKKYGYNKPVTSCFEWRGRGTSPGNLSELQQAQFYTRDVLMAMSHNAANINPGWLFDSSDMYYYSRWGATGFTKRYPLMTPKISYVAMAVFTQQLDQAKFVRTLKTNTPALNVLEFQRGGMWTYALWTPRGEKQATLTFERNADKPALIDMNGQSSTVKVQGDKATLTVSASPSYFHTGVRLASVAGGDSILPTPDNLSIVTDGMDASNWTVSSEWDKSDDPMLLNLNFDVPRELGFGSVANVIYPQKGSVLEVTPQSTPDAPWPIAHTIVLKAKQPIELTGTPQHMGMWVKGNGGWDRIYFKFRDAQGRTLFSFGTPSSGWDNLDWKGETFLNFDGWHFVSLKLPALFADGFDQPQHRNWYLLFSINVQYPLKLEGIYLDVRSKVIQVNQPVDVTNPKIQLFGVGGY